MVGGSPGNQVVGSPSRKSGRLAHHVRNLELAAMRLFIFIGLAFDNQIVVRLGHWTVHSVFARLEGRAQLLALAGAHGISKAGPRARRWDGGEYLRPGEALLARSARKVVHQHVENVRVEQEQHLDPIQRVDGVGVVAPLAGRPGRQVAQAIARRNDGAASVALGRELHPHGARPRRVQQLGEDLLLAETTALGQGGGFDGVERADADGLLQKGVGFLGTLRNDCV
mmetsp:Transcript_30907/g.72301  ORF Transcript_30907/g.72301 Transcript_30907/m.72301 type:complete len:226 (-) Transcript_30907:34-711(-)